MSNMKLLYIWLGVYINGVGFILTQWDTWWVGIYLMALSVGFMTGIILWRKKEG